MIFGPKTIRTVPVNFDEKLVITAGKTLLYSTGSLYLDRFNNYPDPPTHDRYIVFGPVHAKRVKVGWM